MLLEGPRLTKIVKKMKNKGPRLKEEEREEEVLRENKKKTI
jgi:hypothetical protein